MNTSYVAMALPVLPCIAFMDPEGYCHPHFTDEETDAVQSIEQFAQDHTPTKWQRQDLNLLLLTQIPMHVPVEEIKTSPTL